MNDAPSNVEFFTKAKTLNRTYKKQSYSLTYLPPTKTWRWEVIWISKSKFTDEAKTMNAAQKAAEKHIDTTLKARGK